MSAVLMVVNGNGEIAVACDSASFLGDWQIPGGQMKVQTLCDGAIIMGACGNKRYGATFRNGNRDDAAEILAVK